MKITISDDNGVVLDQIDVAEEIGNLNKPLPQAELMDRIKEAFQRLETLAALAKDRSMPRRPL